MRDQLIDQLVQGAKLPWALFAALGALTTLVVLFHRSWGPGKSLGLGRVLGLLALTSGTSLAALPVATALAVPRVRFRAVDPGDLAAPGGETWRKLRGPAVQVADGPQSIDVGLPTLDAAGEWVLVGLLSGKRVPGLDPAPAAEPGPGAPRLCRQDAPECRAWPASWPDPREPINRSELVWGRAPTEGDRMAYDVETGLFLRGERRSEAGPAVEIAGRLSGDALRPPPSVAVVVWRIGDERLSALRVVAFPGGPPGAAATGMATPTFQAHRADVSLTAGRRALRLFVQPLLWLTSFALPLGLLFYLVGAALLGRSRSEEDPRGAAQRLLGWIDALAALGAGLSVAAPAVVALASLWGPR